MSLSDQKLGGGRSARGKRDPTEPCRLWMQGHCRFGAKCRYRHDEKDRAISSTNYPDIQDSDKERLEAGTRSQKLASSSKRKPGQRRAPQAESDTYAATSKDNVGEFVPAVQDKPTNSTNDTNSLGNYTCWAWRTGLCSKGKACPFKHEDVVPHGINNNAQDAARLQKEADAEDRKRTEMDRLERERIAREAAEQKLRQEELEKRDAEEKRMNATQQAWDRSERRKAGRKVAEEKRRQEELKKREAEEMEQKRVQEAQRAKLERERVAREAAEERLRQEAEEAERRVEESKRRAEEAKRRVEEAKRRAEEQEKKRIEEEVKKQAAAEAKKKAEEEAKKQAEEEARKQVEAQEKKQVREEAKKRAEERVHEDIWKSQWSAALAIEKRRRKEAQELQQAAEKQIQQQQLAVDHRIRKDRGTYTEQRGLVDGLAEKPKNSPQFRAPSEKTTMPDHTVKVKDESPTGYYESQMDEYLRLQEQLLQEGLLHKPQLQPGPQLPSKKTPSPKAYQPEDEGAARQDTSVQQKNALLELEILQLRKELQDRDKETADVRKTRDHFAEMRHEEVIGRLNELRRLGEVSPKADRPAQPETPVEGGGCIIA